MEKEYVDSKEFGKRLKAAKSLDVTLESLIEK